MKKAAIRFLALAMLVAGFAACKKDYGNQLAPLQDSLAPIPVTVTNQVYFERFPVVTCKVDTGTVAQGSRTSSGTFSIAFSIPADKGKIKEITKVAMGGGGTEYLQDSHYPNYLPVAVAGNGSNTITFTSSLSAVRDYNSRLTTAFAGLSGSYTKTPAYSFSGLNAGIQGTLTPNRDPQAPNQLRFFFLLTLEDGQQLIPTEIDVRLL
jgi:hypothetical protein